MADPNLTDWGIYAYFAADVPAPAMRSAAKRNLRQLADVGSSEKVGITAQIDLSGEPTRRYFMPAAPKDQRHWNIAPLWSRENLNSADEQAIRDFFSWSVQHCPARNVALVIWGHGYGIDDYDPRQPDAPVFPDSPEMEFLAPKAPGPNFARLSADLPLTMPGKRASERATLMVSDSTFDTVLTNYQVADALRHCKESLPAGQQLALVVFDCCEMAMAEVFGEMEDTASIAIASQAGMPYTSMPWDLILKQLLPMAESPPAEIARMIVREFVAYYANKPHVYVTLSACALTVCSEVEAAVTPLAEALTRAAKDQHAREAIFRSRNSCPTYDPDGFIDLDCFCAFLEKDLQGTAVSAACAGVREALRTFIIDSGYSPRSSDRMISLSRGVSIWFPPWIEDPSVQIPQKERSVRYLSDGYRNTRFARNTGWDRFLLSMANNSANMTEMEVGMANAAQGETKEQDPRETGGEKGKKPDQMGKVPQMGRGVFGDPSTSETGVIVRASVEAFGPVGDTELTVNVKWPAASIGAIRNVPVDVGAHQGTVEAHPSSSGNVAAEVKRRPEGQ